MSSSEELLLEETEEEEDEDEDEDDEEDDEEDEEEDEDELTLPGSSSASRRFFSTSACTLLSLEALVAAARFR